MKPATGSTIDRPLGGMTNPFEYWDAVREENCDGDARRCPRHPHVKTSSADGMHDAPCGECEAAMDDWDSLIETEAK